MEPLQVRLDIKSGFSIRSGYGIAGLLDGTIMKDKNGLPYIPGTTLKGILKQACAELALVNGQECYDDVVSEIREVKRQEKDPNLRENLSYITRIFGSPFCPPCFEINSAFLSPADKDEIELLKLATCWAESRNKIHPETGTAEEDHLFTNEIASGSNAFQMIANRSFGFSVSPKEASIPDELTSLLICGMRFVDRIGAGKSRGKGVIEMILPPDKFWGKTLSDWIAITFKEDVRP